MDELESLNHSKWECKYHVVFIPKCRRKTLYMQLRQYLGEVFRKLAEQKESRIEEGHLMSDHVHMMCQSALKSFQVTASKSFHFVSPLSAAFCVV
jgi:REP element-mobilizing transposase RayT